MIGSLRGRLLDRALDAELLIEVAGVGYRVRTTPAAAAALGEIGAEVFLHVHHAVRAEDEALYGFATITERRLFETLITTQGVGPALALAIMSVHDLAALRDAVAADDVAALCLVPGIGKKTAVRLLVELKSRLDLPGADAPPGADAGGGAGPDVRADLRSALEGLGYGAEEIRAALAELPATGDRGELLRTALRRLAGEDQVES